MSITMDTTLFTLETASLLEIIMVKTHERLVRAATYNKRSKEFDKKRLTGGPFSG